MHRSQIILREDQYAYLVNEAQRQGTSISQVVRELIDEHMTPTRDLSSDPFFDIIGMVEGDDPHAALDHDHYIYGLSRRSETEYTSSIALLKSSSCTTCSSISSRSRSVWPLSVPFKSIVCNWAYTVPRAAKVLSS